MEVFRLILLICDISVVLMLLFVLIAIRVVGNEKCKMMKRDERELDGVDNNNNNNNNNIIENGFETSFQVNLIC